MSEQIYTAFLTIDYLQNSLQEFSASFVAKLTDITDRSNEQVDNDISPHISTPVDAGDSIFSHCRTLALRHAKMLWADEELNDMDKMEKYQTLYDNKLESVTKELKARRTEKTKTVLISKDPRDAKTILPTQASVLAFHNF